MTQTNDYFVNIYATIRWDDSCQAVVVIWHRYAPSAEYRQVKNKVLELLVLQRGCQILTDDTNRGVIDLKDQEWTAQDWFPRAVAAGYVRIARVITSNLLTKLAVDRTRRHRSSPDSFEEDQFATFEEAKAWLMTQAKNNPGLPASSKSIAIPKPYSTTPTIPEVIYDETTFYKIKWVDISGYAYSEAKVFMDSEMFSNQLRKTSELLLVKKATGCILDVRRVTILAPENQDFLATEWTQKLPISLRRLALLFPQSTTMQMVTKRILRQEVKRNFELTFFDNEQEAIKWVSEAR